MGFVGWLWWVMRLPPPPPPPTRAHSPGQRIIEGGVGLRWELGSAHGVFLGAQFCALPSTPFGVSVSVLGAYTLPSTHPSSYFSWICNPAVCAGDNGPQLAQCSVPLQQRLGVIVVVWFEPKSTWSLRFTFRFSAPMVGARGYVFLLGRRPLSLKLPAAQLPGMPEGSHFFFCVPEVPAVPAAYIWSQIALRADR
jgi:hypothetical protein